MSRMILTAILATSSALMAWPAAIAAGEVYRWVDEHGVVHYGDRLPEGVQGSAVNVRPNTVQVVQPQARPAGEPDAAPDGEGDEAPEMSRAQKQREERAERRRQARQEAQKLEAQCTAMQHQKDFLEPSPRVLVTGEDGEVRRLDDEERLDALNQANDFLSKNCN